MFSFAAISVARTLAPAFLPAFAFALSLSLISRNSSGGSSDSSNGGDISDRAYKEKNKAYYFFYDRLSNLRVIAHNKGEQ
jgi:hypothetical protein